MAFTLELSAEQKSLRDSARAFARDKMAPLAREADRLSEFPPSVLSAAYELGLVNLVISDTTGGTGLSNLDAVIVMEELAWGCAGMTTSFVANDLALVPIQLAGTAEQKERFITKIIEQRQLVSFCLSEPGAGSDVAGMKTRLTKVEGGYRLTGNKQWITNGGVAAHG